MSDKVRRLTKELADAIKKEEASREMGDHIRERVKAKREANAAVLRSHGFPTDYDLQEENKNV